MSDEPADGPDDARRAFLKRMAAVGFAVPLITTFEPVAAGASEKHDDKHRHHHEHHHHKPTTTQLPTRTVTKAPNTTTIPPTSTAVPFTTTVAPTSTAVPFTTTTTTTTPHPSTTKAYKPAVR